MRRLRRERMDRNERSERRLQDEEREAARPAGGQRAGDRLGDAALLELIGERLGATLILMLTSIGLAVVVGLVAYAMGDDNVRGKGP